MSRINRIALSAFFVLSVAAWFLAQTVLTDTVPDGAAVALSAVGALAFAAVVAPPSRRALPTLSGPVLGASVAAGVLMVFVAPVLVVANRLTDAPPGSEVLFFTTAGWGALCVLAALALSNARPTPAHLAFACLGVLGVAALAANWERPSSFSPLVRYPAQEYWFLVAGLAWAAGSVLLSRASSASDRRSPLFVAAASGAVVAVVWAVISSGAELFGAVTQELTPCLVAMVAFGVMYATWTQLSVTRPGLVAASSLWFLPALVVTVLGVAEQRFGPHGPDPIVWAGALGGAVLCAAAAGGMTLTDSASITAHAPATARPSSLAVAGLGLAAVSALLGVVALALPAFQASVSGTLSSGQAYDVTWTLAGYESAGGWAAALAGALLVISATAPRFFGKRTAWVCLVGAVVSAAAYFAVAGTPLHTWNRWVPTELQSEYGTEYVRLTFSTIHDPVRLAGLAVAAVAALVIAASLLMSKDSDGDRSEVIS